MGLALTFAAVSCGPPKPAKEQTAACRPYGLTVLPHDGGMTVTWKADCPQAISGYNIYIMSESVVGLSITAPFNSTVYPGDTDPGDDVVYYEAEGLECDVRYFVTVRTVFADQTMSESCEPRVAVCGPRGEIQLDLRYSSDRDGFSFAQNNYVSADATTNDLYFYSKDGVHYLASPDRLDGFLRRSLFQKLPPQTDVESLLIAGNPTRSRPSQDRLPVREGDVVWIRTDEGYQAQVKIGKINVGDGEGTIGLSYEYYPLRVL